MKNYQIEAKDGTKHWISRSTAVAAMIVTSDDYILVVKRGKGAASHQGLWCLPCGYLDYGETLKEACARELLEETNLCISTSCLHLCEIDDDPTNFNQNISVIFYATLSVPHEYCDAISAGTGGEPDEIEQAIWLPISEVDSLDFAFGHDELIKEEYW